MAVTADLVLRVRNLIFEADDTLFRDEDIIAAIAAHDLPDASGRSQWLNLDKTIPNQLWVPNYDVYLAAADLLEVKLAQVSCQVDVSQEGSTYNLSQRYDQISRLITRYRGRRKSRVVKLRVQPMASNAYIGNLPEV